MQEQTKTQPVDRIRIGRITAAIWRQTTEDGKQFYNFTLQRTYKDNDGNYQSSPNFALSDALIVAKVADRADTKIRRLLSVDAQAAQADELESEEV